MANEIVLLFEGMGLLRKKTTKAKQTTARGAQPKHQKKEK